MRTSADVLAALGRVARIGVSTPVRARRRRAGRVHLREDERHARDRTSGRRDGARRSFPARGSSSSTAARTRWRRGSSRYRRGARRPAGEPLERCVDAALETTTRTRYLFTPASLEYLRRGGRIGTASALLGQLLQIKPILTVEPRRDHDASRRCAREKRALAEMARVFADDVAERGLSARWSCTTSATPNRRGCSRASTSSR